MKIPFHREGSIVMNDVCGIFSARKNEVSVGNDVFIHFFLLFLCIESHLRSVTVCVGISSIFSDFRYIHHVVFKSGTSEWIARELSEEGRALVMIANKIQMLQRVAVYQG